MVVTIDGAGRLVIPKSIREQAGFAPNLPLEISVRDGKVEIEPAPRAVEIVKKGRVHVAVPVHDSDRLDPSTVEATRQRLRERDR